jgi:Flp pilus assembly protein TadB
MAPDAAELPRAVRKGPPITVKCECGERRDLRYGERWRCEGCGRNYDTNRIPIEEYASLQRDRVRNRILPSAIFVALACVVLVFVLIGRPLAAVLVVPLVGFVWGTFIRPGRRRRQLRAIAERPRWTIRAD